MTPYHARSSTRLHNVQVRADPQPEVHWFRDGAEIDVASHPRVVMRHEGDVCALELQGVADEDAGRYMCEASNVVGRVSTYARLQVVADPCVLEADTRLKRSATPSILRSL